MTAGLDWNDWKYPDYDPRDTTRQMTLSGDWLFIDLPKSAEKAVRSLDENEFLYSLKGYGDVRLKFTDDGTGNITQMVAYFGYANITFRKKT